VAESGAPSAEQPSRVFVEYTDLTWQPSKMSQSWRGCLSRTVSRVINRGPHVRDEIRQKVLRAADTLEYRPHYHARHMRTQRSKVFGFLSDDIATTPFAGQIIQGAQEAAWQLEMLLLTFNTAGNATMEEAAVQMALERGVEGIIFATMYHRAVQVPKDAFRLPLVLVDCFARNCPVPSVVPDEVNGGFLATKLLLEKGHRRIAMINADQKYPAAVGRFRGYRPIPNPNQSSIPLVVTIPPTAADTGTPPSASPTGIVFNPSGSAFPLLGTGGKPAIFIFDAEDGAISGWNPTVDLTHAKTAKDNSGSGAVYKGLAIGTRSNGSLAIYATNFHAGTVDAFDSSFNPITGGFVDPSVPTGYAPFGIANIDNKIYVTFALQNDEKHDDVAGKGHGFVDVFSADGVFIRRLIPFNDMTGPLNSPWGLARVPQEFREFRHKFGGFGDNVLLVGNFGDGNINAFDIRTGAALGPLQNRRGEPLSFNGLWALVFLDNRLYFTAGIGDESHGLFGVIRSVDKEKEEDSHE
jgi:uncharacterized protein (TIGR03118 family)